MFVFSDFFPYYGNLRSPCSGNFYVLRGKISPSPWVGKMDILIYSPWNGGKNLKFLQKSTAWERYDFPQNISMLREFVHSQTSCKISKVEQNLSVFCPTCSVIWEFTHPIFWELYRFLLHVKCVRNTYTWTIFVFSQFPINRGIQFPIFWKLYGFLLHAKYLRKP